MKKILLAVSALFLINAIFAQDVVKTRDNMKVQKVKTTMTGREEAVPQQVMPMTRAMAREFIGTTYYDLQTNGSMPQKVVAHQDGTVSAVWTTNGPSSNSTRGTGYNYFNGTSWVNPASSTDRIESVRTGWGTMTCVGDVEIVASHNGSNALVIGICPQKGTQNWTFTTKQGPAVAHGSQTSTCLLWPALASSGNTIHMLACTESDAGYLYQGIQTCLLYYRGTFNPSDNTITWEEPRIVGNVTSAEVKQFSGDAYAIAAKGNTVAILNAPTFSDVFLWKSTDNGQNFTKTTVFEHPYQGFEESTTLVTDTPYVADGSCAVAIDDNGGAHVAFGITRMLNDDITDGSYSYFPGVCAMLYWNENMQPIVNTDANSLLPENLVNAGYKVFSRVDQNGDGGAYWSGGDVSIPGYGVGGVSVPQIIAKGGKVYMIYTALMDWPFFYFDEPSSAAYYRGVFGCQSADNGTTWSDNTSWLSYNKRCYYIDDWWWAADTTITLDDMSSTIYQQGENMFPAVAQQVVNGKLVLTWQYHYLPGSEIKENSASMNQQEANIFYQMIDIDSLGLFNNTTDIWQGLCIDPLGISNEAISGMKMYPNPASESVNISFSADNAENGEITVTNLMGQLVYSNNVEVTEGYNFINLPVKQLNSGIYMVTIRTNTGISTQKLIVK
jgi:hypothetical protein